MTKDHPTGQSRIGPAGRLWIVATLLYGIVRVVLAGAFVADYGLNIAVFAVVEITSSIVLGFTTARLASLVSRRDFRPPIWLWMAAGVSYLAPDAYVLAFAGRMPGRILTPVVVIVLAGLVATVVRFRRVRSSSTSGS